MENEKYEQVAPATPLLDSILEELPPSKLELKLRLPIPEIEKARERLSQKMNGGTLTQRDIELELSNLHDKATQMELLERFRIDLHGNDIKTIPVE